ncbi:MAG TPA: TraR/DksA C4-type zinc finger protein [Spirochaetota bacterium]|nr:TraR/DksA C4-type zinc finger protein [Spirochaetota bacterium]HOM38342.1 TraR/DksA C4-type zinc finger protein [Spirochaetota bacterium]HPQ48440.1 TraR/DksA C4-type zinc finger protein [Spirochaetota bacterium]
MKHLSKEQLNLLKELLIKEKQEILDEFIDEENIINNSAQYVEDVGEQAFDSIDKNILIKLSEKNRKKLKSIEEALEAIDKGTYGICGCGKEISFERLEILPYTKYCKECSKKTKDVY